MKKLASVWLVATQELRERVRTRAFLIITALIVVMSAGGVVAADYLPGLFEEGPKHVGVAAPAASGLEQDLAQSAGSLGVDIEVRSFADRASGEAALRDGDVDALVTGQNELVFNTSEDSSLTAVVNRALYVRSLPGILDELGLSYERVRPLVEPQGASIALLDGAAADGATTDTERRLVASVVAMFLALALILYGQGLMMGVIEEKTSRVVEVLLGTLRPAHLLAGKVLGMVAAVMSQLVAALLAAVVALMIVGAADLPSGTLDVALVSCIFFVLGIISYSFIYATVGATVSRQSEAEPAQMPISLVLAVPLLLSQTAIPDNPDGMFSRLLSLLPPTAPIAMPARVATGDPLPVEIIAAVALMLPWVLAVIWLGARVYAGAILQSGPRIGLLAAWRRAGETLSA